jgi:hypothetical protein
MKKYSDIGNLTEFAKKVEKLFSDEFCKGEKPAIAIAFSLPHAYENVHYVTNVSRQDAINLFEATAEIMISRTN